MNFIPDQGGGDAPRFPRERAGQRANWRRNDNVAGGPNNAAEDHAVGFHNMDQGARPRFQHRRQQNPQNAQQRRGGFNRQDERQGYDHRRRENNEQRNNGGNNNQDGGRRFNRNDDRRHFERRNRNDHDNNNRNENPQQNRKERCMGFKALEEIALSTEGDILVKVNEKKTAFLNLLEAPMDPSEKGDFYILIMEVLQKICHSSFDTIKLRLLLEVCNSRFMVNLRNYLAELPYTEVKRKNSRYWNSPESFWNNYVTFCQCLIDLSPSTALQKCRSLIEAITKVCLEGLRDRHDFTEAETYLTKFNQLRDRLMICEKEEQDKTEKRKKGIMDDDGLEPPDNFRELSVVPRREDLLDEKPFLRANVVSGGYRDVEHYLDVQFRLLREDCFGPLREGIAQFLKDPKNNKYDNIRVYTNVTFVEPYISKNKIGETVKLDEKSIKRLKRINWAHSKRFIFGSLLLFTQDNCRSFITATILERDIKLLVMGKIPVTIQNADVDIKYDSLFTMIKSEVYFEPYLHVMKALQDPEFPDHLAMRKYIVAVDSEPRHPEYTNPDLTYTLNIDKFVRIKFRVLDENTWASKEELGFNESQYAAYRLALTHEFAVIQGPPGTGKTFLGVKVAKTILENLSAPKTLMLLICYTNHALDQFLEAILPITNSIVRIGGQSRNEAMEAINLTTLRKKTQMTHETRRFFYEQKSNLTHAVRELQRAQEKLDSINNGVISFNCLAKYVPEVNILGHFYAQNRKDVKSDPLRYWLFEGMANLHFNDIVRDENPEEENENTDVYIVDVDDDNERIEVILDEFEEDDGLFEDLLYNEDINLSFSFSVMDARNKAKTMIMLYNRSSDQQKKAELKKEIIDLKSRENHFNQMVGNKNNEAQLRIHNRINFNSLSMPNRWTIYFRWVNVIINKLKTHMQPIQAQLDTATNAYEEARMIVDAKVLEGVKVIGMTTSGAARQRKLLKTLSPRIVIVEEAAEVLEQHIVTSLTKDCQHLILIGDHQQLRPSAAHMRLARFYNLEVSLFERMIKNGVHSRRLSVQHRMRPEIASLICPHIYPELLNHPSVEQFPKVKGMADDLFFFTHNFKEELVEDTASKCNQLEADVTLGLANYIMQQGYEPGDVTILAAYSGQMFYMRKQREKYRYLQKVKITVVDNYQGEESKIILLSLVRNNDQNKTRCKEPCSKICPPCPMICEVKCPHSKCKKLCGAPCTPCTEPCTRRCEHGACTRRCGQACSRAACELPCARALPCGHRCRGLCGEPCPDICKTCRPDDFPRDFLGDEYDDDAMFVVFEDCKHVLDVENMDNLMRGDMEEVKIRQCPLCRTPIINTQRYRDIINNMIKTHINAVKEKLYGNEHIIKLKREELSFKVNEFFNEHEHDLERNPHIKKALAELHKIANSKQKISLPRIETQLQYFVILEMIMECCNKYAAENTTTLQTEINNQVNFLCSTLITNIDKISEQLQEDIGNEIRRTNSIVQLAKLLSHSLYASSKTAPKVKQAAAEATEAVLCWHRFDRGRATAALEALEHAMKASGVITKEERDLVVKAIGSKPGSWYRCPNGHYYCIGQCGGAMEVSACADCGAPIGGSGHRLLASNAHAGELDHSPHAAWSDLYDNPANWRL